MSARRLSDAESCTSFGDPRQGCFARYINMATARKCLHTSGVLLLLLLIVFLWRSATASPTCNSYGYYCYNATHYVNCKAPTGVGGGSRPGNGIPQVCPRAGLCADNIPERCQSADTNCGTNDHVCLNATHFQFCVETSVGTMLRMGNVESCGPYMQCRENVPVICVETPPLAETLLTNGRKKPCNEFGYKCLNSTHYKTCENDVPTGIIERCPTNKLCSSNHPAVCAEPVMKPCGSMGHVCLNDTHFQSCVVDSNGALHTTGQIDICHGGTVCNESSPSICDYPILDKDTLSKGDSGSEKRDIDNNVQNLTNGEKTSKPEVIISTSENSYDQFTLNAKTTETIMTEISQGVELNKYDETSKIVNSSENSMKTTPPYNGVINSTDTTEEFQSNSNSENESTTEYNNLMEMHLITEPHILNSSKIDSNVSKSMDEITESVINNGETTIGNAVEISSPLNISSEVNTDASFESKTENNVEKNKINNENIFSDNDAENNTGGMKDVLENLTSTISSVINDSERNIITTTNTSQTGYSNTEPPTSLEITSSNVVNDNLETTTPTLVEIITGTITENKTVYITNNMSNGISSSQVKNEDFLENEPTKNVSLTVEHVLDDSLLANDTSDDFERRDSEREEFLETKQHESLVSTTSEDYSVNGNNASGAIEATQTDIIIPTTIQGTGESENETQNGLQCTEKGRFAHPSGNDSLFYCCVYSGDRYAIFTYACPPGSVFSAASQKCVTFDTFHQNDTYQEVNDSTVNKTSPAQDVCESAGKFPSSSGNCSVFYVCMPFRNTLIKREFECPRGSEFNSQQTRCMIPEKANCSIPYNEFDNSTESSTEIDTTTIDVPVERAADTTTLDTIAETTKDIVSRTESPELIILNDGKFNTEISSSTDINSDIFTDGITTGISDSDVHIMDITHEEYISDTTDDDFLIDRNTNDNSRGDYSAKYNEITDKYAEIITDMPSVTINSADYNTATDSEFPTNVRKHPITDPSDQEFTTSNYRAVTEILMDVDDWSVDKNINNVPEATDRSDITTIAADNFRATDTITPSATDKSTYIANTLPEGTVEETIGIGDVELITISHNEIALDSSTNSITDISIGNIVDSTFSSTKMNDEEGISIAESTAELNDDSVVKFDSERFGNTPDVSTVAIAMNLMDATTDYSIDTSTYAGIDTVSNVSNKVYTGKTQTNIDYLKDRKVTEGAEVASTQITSQNVTVGTDNTITLDITEVSTTTDITSSIDVINFGVNQVIKEQSVTESAPETSVDNDTFIDDARFNTEYSTDIDEIDSVTHATLEETQTTTIAFNNEDILSDGRVNKEYNSNTVDSVVATITSITESNEVSVNIEDQDVTKTAEDAAILDSTTRTTIVTTIYEDVATNDPLISNSINNLTTVISDNTNMPVKDETEVNDIVYTPTTNIAVAEDTTTADSDSIGTAPNAVTNERGTPVTEPFVNVGIIEITTTDNINNVYNSSSMNVEAVSDIAQKDENTTTFNSSTAVEATTKNAKDSTIIDLLTTTINNIELSEREDGTIFGISDSTITPLYAETKAFNTGIYNNDVSEDQTTVITNVNVHSERNANSPNDKDDASAISATSIDSVDKSNDLSTTLGSEVIAGFDTTVASEIYFHPETTISDSDRSLTNFGTVTTASDSSITYSATSDNGFRNENIPNTDSPLNDYDSEIIATIPANTASTDTSPSVTHTTIPSISTAKIASPSAMSPMTIPTTTILTTTDDATTSVTTSPLMDTDVITTEPSNTKSPTTIAPTTNDATTILKTTSITNTLNISTPTANTPTTSIPPTNIPITNPTTTTPVISTTITSPTTITTPAIITSTNSTPNTTTLSINPPPTTIPPTTFPPTTTPMTTIPPTNIPITTIPSPTSTSTNTTSTSPITSIPPISIPPTIIPPTIIPPTIIPPTINSATIIPPTTLPSTLPTTTTTLVTSSATTIPTNITTPTITSNINTPTTTTPPTSTPPTNISISTNPPLTFPPTTTTPMTTIPPTNIPITIIPPATSTITTSPTTTIPPISIPSTIISSSTTSNAIQTTTTTTVTSTTNNIPTTITTTPTTNSIDTTPPSTIPTTTTTSTTTIITPTTITTPTTTTTIPTTTTTSTIPTTAPTTTISPITIPLITIPPTTIPPTTIPPTTIPPTTISLTTIPPTHIPLTTTPTTTSPNTINLRAPSTSSTTPDTTTPTTPDITTPKTITTLNTTNPTTTTPTNVITTTIPPTIMPTTNQTTTIPVQSKTTTTPTTISTTPTPTTSTTVTTTTPLTTNPTITITSPTTTIPPITNPIYIIPPTTMSLTTKLTTGPTTTTPVTLTVNTTPTTAITPATTTTVTTTTPKITTPSTTNPPSTPPTIPLITTPTTSSITTPTTTTTAVISTSISTPTTTIPTITTITTPTTTSTTIPINISTSTTTPTTNTTTPSFITTPTTTTTITTTTPTNTTTTTTPSTTTTTPTTTTTTPTTTTTTPTTTTTTPTTTTTTTPTTTTTTTPTTTTTTTPTTTTTTTPTTTTPTTTTPTTTTTILTTTTTTTPTTTTTTTPATNTYTTPATTTTTTPATTTVTTPTTTTPTTTTPTTTTPTTTTLTTTTIPTTTTTTTPTTTTTTTPATTTTTTPATTTTTTPTTTTPTTTTPTTTTPTTTTPTTTTPTTTTTIPTTSPTTTPTTTTTTTPTTTTTTTPTTTTPTTTTPTTTTPTTTTLTTTTTTTPTTTTTTTPTTTTTTTTPTTTTTTPTTTTTTLTATPQPFICSSIGKFINPAENTSYYICSPRYGGGFHTMRFSCPPGAVFFPALGKCASVQWSSGTATTSHAARLVKRSVDLSASDDEGNSFVCRTAGWFADPNECSGYYVCVPSEGDRFSRLALKCPTGSSFDPVTAMCRRDLPCGIILVLHD